MLNDLFAAGLAALERRDYEGLRPIYDQSDEACASMQRKQPLDMTVLRFFMDGAQAALPRLAEFQSGGGAEPDFDPTWHEKIKAAMEGAADGLDLTLSGGLWSSLKYTRDLEFLPPDAVLDLLNDQLAEKADRIGSGSTDLWADNLFIGELGFLLKRFGLAVDKFSRANLMERRMYGPHDPRLSPTLEKIACALAADGQREHACRLFQRAFLLDGGQYLDNIAIFKVELERVTYNCFFLGDYPSAFELYQRFLKL